MGRFYEIQATHTHTHLVQELKEARREIAAAEREIRNREADITGLEAQRGALEAVIDDLRRAEFQRQVAR